MISSIVPRLSFLAIRRVVFAAALILFSVLVSAGEESLTVIPDIISPNARNIAFVAQKIRGGQTVRIGFLGGSITQGAGAKSHADSYYRKTVNRLIEFAGISGASIEPLQAAVGGTGSDYGAHRVGLQLLDKNIDLLVVEFAVNDFQNPNALDGMEGIVRQALVRNPHTAIVLFYTANWRMIEECYDKEILPPSVVAFHRIAQHYNLAEVNAGPKLRELFASGGGTPDLFFPDKTHPTAEGHAFYANILSEALITGFQSVVAAAPATKDTTDFGHTLPSPLGSGRFERARLLAISPIATSGAWTQERPGYYTYFGVWKATAAGASLTFEIKAEERVALLCGKFTRLHVTGPGVDKVLRGPGKRNGIPTLQVLHDASRDPLSGLITVTVEPDMKGNAEAEIVGLAVIRAADPVSR